MRLTVLAPALVDLATGEIDRAGQPETAAALLARLLTGLAGEAVHEARKLALATRHVDSGEAVL